MKYVPPYNNGGDADAPYIDGNPSAGIQGSIPRGASFEHIMREVVALITGAGLEPSDTDLQQMLRSVRGGALGYVIGTGTANAQTFALAPPPASWAEVRTITLVPAASNTGGAATLACGALPPLPLRWRGLTDLPAGILMMGVPATITIDGTSAHVVGGTRGRVVMRWITASTSWTAPDGCWSVGYGLWAGGAGGGGVASTGGAASGGGAGGFVPGIASVTPGQIVPVTIGAGGGYGNASGGTSADGGNGGASSFGSYATANGGVGGKAAASLSTGASVAGGSGVGGIGVIPGRPSGGGMKVRDDPGTGVRYIGSPGGSAFGTAPIGQITGTTGPHDAGFPGGGGGGAGSTSTAIPGAPGASGLAWLWEMY